MPLKKSIRLKKSTHLNKSARHSNKSPRLKEYMGLAGRTGAGTIALALVSVAAAALMLAGHQPYHPAAIVSVDAQARTAAPQDDGAKTAAHQDVAKLAAQQEGANTAAPPDGAKTVAQHGAKKAAAMAPAAGAVALRTPAVEATSAIALPAESATKAPGPRCIHAGRVLERADETFRLKDATGVDAPRSRSWKSGFLKKGPASIEIVDAANGLKLPDHVGQRVSVTGTLMDHAMQVRSLQRIAASCTNSAKVRI